MHDVESFLVVELVLGIAFGIYVGVDLALVVDVLPNPEDSGKDLGVFNIANALPQTFAPLIGGALVYVAPHARRTRARCLPNSSVRAGSGVSGVRA